MMMAAHRISSLLSRSLSLPTASSASASASALRRIHRFTTAAVRLEQPITPPLQINYTKLFINGQYVDSASGN